MLERNPFESIDVAGVGQLVEIGVAKGHSVKPNLKTGVCGEHGGDPDSVEFFQSVGLDYVSCSPYRVPIARFAAAKGGAETARGLNRTKGGPGPHRARPSLRFQGRVKLVGRGVTGGWIASAGRGTGDVGDDRG